MSAKWKRVRSLKLSINYIAEMIVTEVCFGEKISFLSKDETDSNMFIEKK